ncbi:MAG: ATP-binding protein [Clostridiales bacterium]|jgi:ATP-dependent DNA helicase RecG|nr:ATP-binding protein [Clostridiales bacterium]
MQAVELLALVESVQKLKCETQTVEVKAAHLGCPTKLYPTLSDFSNQDDGGVFLFGVDEASGFQVVGVYDAQDLQKKVVEQCKQMEPAIRPLFTFCEINGMIVAAAEIPAVDISERPVYYRGVGRVKGSFVRVGDADEAMSEYEIYSYDAFRKRTQDEKRQIVAFRRGSFGAIFHVREKRAKESD